MHCSNLKRDVSRYKRGDIYNPGTALKPFERNLQVYLQECIFTDVGTAALADVLVVNNHIHSIDVRGCKGKRFIKHHVLSVFHVAYPN